LAREKKPQAMLLCIKTFAKKITSNSIPVMGSCLRTRGSIGVLHLKVLSSTTVIYSGATKKQYLSSYQDRLPF